MAKSGSVSRQCPRSSPSTLSPASASSFAMIVPVRPTPTIATSTGFSFVALIYPCASAGYRRELSPAGRACASEAHPSDAQGLIMATKLTPVDVAIVGVGLTGTIIAKELAEAGLKVVGLERGRWRDTDPDFAMPYVHDELRFVRRHEMMQDLSRETITFRNNAAE